MAGLPTHWEDVHLASDPEVSGNRGGIGCLCQRAKVSVGEKPGG